MWATLLRINTLHREPGKRYDVATAETKVKPEEAAPPEMKHTEGFLKLVDDARSRVREVNVEQTLDRMKQGARLIDVREDNEWQRGHAAGAEHLGRGIIERDIETAVPEHGAELILYCGGGYRSALAADNLQKMGYRNVYSMAGGWKAWQEAGAPVEPVDEES